MPKVLVNDENLTNIANAIREKNGETTTYKPSEMASAIAGIVAGGGSGSVKVETQSYTPTDKETVHTFNHNLGAIPDFILIYAHASTLSGDDTTNYAVNTMLGLRKGIFSLGLNRYVLQQTVYKKTTMSGATVTKYPAFATDWDNDITSDTASDTYFLCRADDEKFDFDGTGLSGIHLRSGTRYIVILMSGVSE